MALAAPGTGRTSLDQHLDLGGWRRAQLLTHDRSHEPMHREGEQQIQDERRRKGGQRAVCATTSSSRR